MTDSQSTYNFTLDDTSPFILYAPYCASSVYKDLFQLVLTMLNP